MCQLLNGLHRRKAMADFSFEDELPMPTLGPKSVIIPANLRVRNPETGKSEERPVTIQKNDDGSFYVPIKDPLDRSVKYYLKFRKPKLKAKLKALIGNTDDRIICKCWGISKDGKTGYCGF
jgi:hypothetical protein